MGKKPLTSIDTGEIGRLAELLARVAEGGEGLGGAFAQPLPHLPHDDNEITDIPKLKKIFSQNANHPDSYNNALSYYLLTGRKGLTFRTDGLSQMVISQHPHIPNRLLFFPETNFGSDGLLTARLLSFMALPQGTTVQLARYTEDDYRKLKDSLGKILVNMITERVEVKEIEEDTLDWKYPVHILNTQNTAEMRGKDFEKLRNKVNKVSDVLSVVPLSEDDNYRGVLSMLKDWESGMIWRKDTTGGSLTEFYYSLITVMQQQPGMFDGFLAMYNRKPVGFVIWDSTNEYTANLYASLSHIPKSDDKLAGIAEYLTQQACRILHEKGVVFANMGGSETPELDHFKRKFRPVESIQLKSYEVKVREWNTRSIQGHTLPPLKINYHI